MLQSVFDTTVFAAASTTFPVIQDPLDAISILLSPTSRRTPPERTTSACQATVVSFTVTALFTIFGRYVLKFLGISVPPLQVAEGPLLLLVVLELLTDKVGESPDPEVVTTSTALVPLGTPLLAGPGAVVAAMAAMDIIGDGAAGRVSMTAAIIGTHVAIQAALRFSLGFNWVLDISSIRVPVRVIGLFLTIIAVQIMADGVFTLLETRL